MRYRILLAAATSAAVAATVLPAHAGTPVLDGKAHKVLTFKGASTPQDNDANFVGVQGLPAGGSTRPADYGHCAKTRCLMWSFVYKPAKGVKRGPFSARIDWTLPFEDYDLYVIDTRLGMVAECGASFGTAEIAKVSSPVPGHTYKVVVDNYRAAPDTITATVAFPAKKYTTTGPETTPGALQAPVACGLPG
jgi:hypothetical protein